MSMSWICVKCGTVITSKCPSQRSTFFGPEMGILRSMLMTDVLHVGASRSEVFINITDYESSGDPVARAIEYLADNKEKLKAVTCDHYFILNSKTETKCVLGCEHSNLNDLETIKEELQVTDYSQPVTFEKVLSEYKNYLYNVLMRMKHDAKSTFRELAKSDPGYEDDRNWYFCFQDDADALYNQVGKAIDRLREKTSVRKNYRLMFGYMADLPDVYSDNLDQVIRLARSYKADGIECRVLELVRDTTHYREVEVAYEAGHQHDCDICKENAGRGKVILLEDGKVRHQKCQRKIDNRFKVVTRTIQFNISEEEFELNHMKWKDSIYDAAEDYIYSLVRSEVEVVNAGYTRKGLHVRVTAQNNIIDQIKDIIAGK